MKRKWKRNLIALFCISAMATSSALAVESDIDFNAGATENTKVARSVNKTYTLDFKESNAWTIDFTNSALGFNHDGVTFSYDSFTTSGTNVTGAAVNIDLHVDLDGDGIYERYATDGSYLKKVVCGGSTFYRLPYGREVVNYRIVVMNQNTNVTSGIFSVKTSFGGL